MPLSFVVQMSIFNETHPMEFITGIFILIGFVLMGIFWSDIRRFFKAAHQKRRPD